MTRTRRSLLSALVPPVITLLGYQREFSSAERTLALAQSHLTRPERHAPPRSLRRSVDVTLRPDTAWPVYTLTPKTGAGAGRAVYAHGGAWVHEISPFHWRLMAKLATETATEFTVPIYPLVPIGTAGKVVPAVADLAAALVEEVGADKVTLMGDSAGGTVALAAAMLLRDRGVPSPRDVVLLAPALDLRFTDPLIARIQPTDPWLAVPGPRAAADRWRGDLPLEDPLVSPLFGSLAGLGRITIFTGTHDITHADAVALLGKARADGHPLDFQQKPNMLHDYPLLPIPEGAEARRHMVRILSR
jgi:acetyl esterase/lipase